MDDLDLSACPALAASRSFSVALIAEARASVAAITAELDEVESVAIGGSLGRFEAHRQSDIDCIVVTHEDPGPARAKAIIAQIGNALSELDLKPAKSGGIYRSPVSVASLLDIAALGSLTEPAKIFGKRLHLLLDAKPIFRDQAFHALRARIVDWYGTGYLDAAPHKSWTYLINDVMRYLHAYAAWQQYKVNKTVDDSWQLRQAKFRSTRLITVAGLLVLLGESNAMDEKRVWLLDRLSLTPLERLARVMNHYEPESFTQLLLAYETAHKLLSDPASRAELVVTGPQSVNGLGGETSARFKQMKVTSAEIMGVLTRFVLARQTHWDPRFFERLIF